MAPGLTLRRTPKSPSGWAPTAARSDKPSSSTGVGDWLGNRLQFAHEPRLSDRLHDLAQLAGEGFRWLVPDEEQFIDVVVHVRNRLTHFDEDADRVTESEPLWLCSEALYVLVAVAALSTAQVSEDALAPLRENQRLLWLRRQLGDAPPQSYARAAAWRRGDDAASDEA